jgi:hypothetical protein
MFFALLALVFAIVPATAAQSSGATVYAITDGGDVISFTTSDPSTILTRVALSGLADGDSIAAIDIRPVNNVIYAVTFGGRVATVNPTSGAVAYIGGSLSLQSGSFGLDFNPTVDRIRFTSSSTQDLRLNPNNGALVATDGALTYAANDVNAGQTARIVASAYTNNFVNSTSTTLYNIDSNLDVLTIQNPPNNGTQVTVGALGVDANDNAAFDIISFSNGTDEAYAAFGSGFYRINLANGEATFIGSIGESVRGIAITGSVAASSRIPMCGDFDGNTNPIVRAIAPGASGSVFCRVLAENRQFTNPLASAQIGVQSVISAGVIQAVDVFQQGGNMNSVFSAPAQVCLLGTGRFVYLDGTQTPRQPAFLEFELIDGYTCAFIPNAGTVVLVNS